MEPNAFDKCTNKSVASRVYARAPSIIQSIVGFGKIVDGFSENGFTLHNQNKGVVA